MERKKPHTNTHVIEREWMWAQLSAYKIFKWEYDSWDNWKRICFADNFNDNDNGNHIIITEVFIIQFWPIYSQDNANPWVKLITLVQWEYFAFVHQASLRNSGNGTYDIFGNKQHCCSNSNILFIEIIWLGIVMKNWMIRFDRLDHCCTLTQ